MTRDDFRHGGGNFLAALGLLCYTEFGGKLKYDRRKRDGREHASENFNDFFADLGTEYEALLIQHNIYDVFRCGLVHEYYVKRSCTIKMVDTGASAGIMVEAAGRYHFIVEKYCSDLEVQFDVLEKHLFP